jgi:hypothetical protein
MDMSNKDLLAPNMIEYQRVCIKMYESGKTPSCELTDKLHALRKKIVAAVEAGEDASEPALQLADILGIR